MEDAHGMAVLQLTLCLMLFHLEDASPKQRYQN